MNETKMTKELIQRRQIAITNLHRENEYHNREIIKNNNLIKSVKQEIFELTKKLESLSKEEQFCDCGKQLITDAEQRNEICRECI